MGIEQTHLEGCPIDSETTVDEAWDVPLNVARLGGDAAWNLMAWTCGRRFSSTTIYNPVVFRFHVGLFKGVVYN